MIRANRRFRMLCLLTAMMVASAGCRTVAHSLFNGLLGADRHSTRGKVDEPGISSREKQRRLDEIHINQAMADPNWEWAP